MTAALGVFLAYAIALAFAWDSAPTTIAVIQACAGAVLVIPLLALGFGARRSRPWRARCAAPCPWRRSRSSSRSSGSSIP